MKLCLGIYTAVVLLFVSISNAERSDTRILLTSNATLREQHGEDYCAMYDICGARSDGKVVNCPFGSPSVKPDDLLSAKIQSLCPTISGNICCTEAQFDTLRAQVQQAIPFLVGCPACLRNFLNLFCELSCSPHQSQFINVTSIAKVKNNSTVGSIDYYITDTYGEGLFESCKEVKFGTMNSRAIEFVGAGAKNFREWFAFIGRKASPNLPGSPYAINFRSDADESIGMKPMNVTAYSCGDTSLGCSCGDCPSSPVCSSSAPPSLHEKGSCSVRIGSLKARCVEVSVAIVYILLASLFLGWGLFHKRGARNPALRTKPLVNVANGGLAQQVRGKKDENQMLDDIPQMSSGVQVSIVQGYMAKIFRLYGTWVARNPILVLCSSLAVVLLLGLGLIRFKVETRPEKLWVGHGSRAAEEKLYFDSHLAPFYRIEQLILATKPQAPHDKPPTIVTEGNIKLLFQIQDKVDGIRANYTGSLVSLTDICMKPLGEACATQSILQYFKMDPKNYDDYGGVEHAEYCFQDELLPMLESKNLTLSYSSESSIEEELKRESSADAITILISYLVMFAYISLALGDTPRFTSFYISSKVLLGLSGVMLVMLSVIASVGFFSAVGVKSTLIIMEVIPFLVLAVGVDNMCILVHAVKRQQMELPLEDRISNALAEVGPSITLASLSEVLAFAVGSFIPMPACRVFSMFAALAILLDFLLQVTAFVALIVFDFLRAEDHRVDCFPCIRISGSFVDTDQGSDQRKSGLLARYMKEVHAPILGIWVVKLVVVSVFAALSLASIALCTRIQPGLEQQIVLPRDSYLQGYFNNVSEYLRIGPPLYFVLKNYNYSSESRQTNQLCSINHCDSDSLLNEISKASLVPTSSYIAKPAASWLDDFLVWVSPEAFGCCRKFTNGSYCAPDDQPPCCSMSDGSCSVNGVCKDCTTCFRHSDFQNERPTTPQFKEKLPWFLSALPSADCAKGGHGAYTNSVELKGFEDGVIQASSFRTYHTPLNKQVDFVNSMRAAREFSSRVSNSLKIEVFPYSVFYMFFEQYLDIWKTALISLAVAIGAVFIVCLVITCSFWSSGIIVLVLVMILVDLLGVMAVLNIQLNAVSVVNLVMSVGIAVEFCVHITHAFMMSSGDRDQRTKEALGTMGASVFSGITITKLVGVIVLCFSRTEIFVVYYFQMYLALVLLGFMHGLIFLPVVLSMFGPPSRQVLAERKEDNKSSVSSPL
ncbi:NPC intracellular cholesterol transporter 1-related protein 1-like isoform X4 [Cynara cardunculus var. scolymus]|uniref:NPC intracellular cholesterol transporter 1-related protein 1-like isoform X4 n=1 Tax=Cynara cardunculus var. scolymus TaxID=59895 RepID=UPI000D62A61B|nr:NPC intracellular cholesterol transporter 1-related protein 1-like isoform X4 [Cynara cardunculus var. scolymus]